MADGGHRNQDAQDTQTCPALPAAMERFVINRSLTVPILQPPRPPSRTRG